MDKKQKIIYIINQEVNRFALEVDQYIKLKDFIRASIAAKALNSLKVMIRRIQDEV